MWKNVIRMEKLKKNYVTKIKKKLTIVEKMYTN